MALVGALLISATACSRESVETSNKGDMQDVAASTQNSICMTSLALQYQAMVSSDTV